MKDNLCALCGGDLVENKVMLARELVDQGTVLIRDVPARVCEQCGHRWLSHAVMGELEALAEGRRKPQTVQQVPVFSLAA